MAAHDRRPVSVYACAWGIAAAIALTACGQAPTPSPEERYLPTPSPASTPLTAVPGPCPVPPGSPTLPALAELPTTAFGLISYLNAGGPLNDLVAALEAGAWLPPREQSLAQADLTGDGLDDLALAVLDPTAERITPPGSLYLLICSGEGYLLAYASPADAQAGGPLLRAVQDLTGDGLPELVVSRGLCGAHTCSEHVEVLRWQGDTFTNVLDGTTEDLPTPSLALDGPTAAGAYDVSITATGIASVGAGPFRPVTRTWSWDPSRQVFAIRTEVLLPSNYRIHVLHDADRALEKGEYAQAHELYRRVILDETLDDWVTGADGRANLGGFAMYRSMLAYLLAHDFGDGRVAYGILQNSYPDEAVGTAYARLARAFWETYEPVEDVAAGCAAAEAFASTHPAEILDPLGYGYANRIYTAGDMCPPLP